MEYCKHYSDIYLIFKYLVTALLITPHVRYTSWTPFQASVQLYCLLWHAMHAREAIKQVIVRNADEIALLTVNKKNSQEEE